ncbi:MAG: 16S rRNA (cytosine(1402)-N(4))-methyltransferase, partial [Candidatus Eremiobacteraeota bacterium]|nr:16S rRNA (cytosine(1402)-N(4))-methyltransferase [Candidatus Eremiobacteraeota bacterium]
MDSISHAPVMLDEVLALLSPAARQSPLPVFVDCTFGAGGLTRSILERIPGSRVIALDADPDAVARAEALRERQPRRVTPVHANFAQLADALESVGVSGVNGIVYDLGLSSLQLGDAARGFAFAGEGALDMRLDPTSDAA